MRGDALTRLSAAVSQVNVCLCVCVLRLLNWQTGILKFTYIVMVCGGEGMDEEGEEGWIYVSHRGCNGYEVVLSLCLLCSPFRPGRWVGVVGTLQTAPVQTGCLTKASSSTPHPPPNSHSLKARYLIRIVIPLVGPPICPSQKNSSSLSSAKATSIVL